MQKHVKGGRYVYLLLLLVLIVPFSFTGCEDVMGLVEEDTTEEEEQDNTTGEDPVGEDPAEEDPTVEDPGDTDIVYTSIAVGQNVTEDILQGGDTLFYYEFTVEVDGTYEITTYTSSGGFFDDSDFVLYDAAGTIIADPVPSEAGNGVAVTLTTGTVYHLHVDHIYHTSTGLTKVEGPTDVETGAGDFEIY